MAELGPKDLVIFEDLPSKETPLNAFNLNHNFDVYNEYIQEESGKIDTTLQDIQDFQTQTEQDIAKKTQTFTDEINKQVKAFTDDISQKTSAMEDSIQDAKDDLTKEITDSNNALTKQITDSNTDLTNQITTSKNELESQINKTREDLITEIGKQIASISSLSILEVETLPTENISETTIYLIKPENLPSSVELGVNTKVSAKSIQSTPTIKPQVFNLNGELLYRELFVKEEQQVSAEVQSSNVTAVQADAIGIPDDEYYIACFWVRTNPDGSAHKWVAVGTTKIDLSEYAKLTDLPNMNLYLTITKANETYAKKTDLPNMNLYLTTAKADETYAKKTEIPDTSGIMKTLGIYDETYSTSSTYAVGDVVVHSHKLYECKTAITKGEAFNSSKWQEISLLVDE